MTKQGRRPVEARGGGGGCNPKPGKARGPPGLTRRLPQKTEDQTIARDGNRWWSSSQGRAATSVKSPDGSVLGHRRETGNDAMNKDYDETPRCWVAWTA